MYLLASRNRAFYVPMMLMFVLGVTNSVVAAENKDDSIELPEVEVTSQANQLGYIELQKQPQVGKMSVPTQDQPYSISIIDKEFIQDTGAQTIEDALLYTPGVNAANFGFDNRIDSAKIRGITPTQYLDGLRQIYGSYNSVRTNPYALESIEVLRGPSSMLYGQGGLGGIINSVTKLPRAEQQGEIWAQYGSYNRKQIAFDVTGPIDSEGEFLYRLVGLKRDSDTQVDFVGNDGYLLAPSLTWQPTDDTSLTLLLNRQENKGKVGPQFLPQVGTLEPGSKGYIDSDTFVGEPNWDRYDREKTELTLFFDHKLTDNWKFEATTRYTDSSTETREHWVTIPSVPDPNGNVPRTIFQADKATEILNFDARVQGEIELGMTRHNLLVGIDRQDARWEEENYFYGYGLGGTINVYDPQYGNLNDSVLDPQDRPDNEIEQVGVYIADHMEIGPVVISAGLRQDWAENRELAVSGTDTVSDEEELTSRFGVMYRFDNGFSPYISYAESFNMNLGTDGTSTANTLKPTTGDQKEIGFKYLSLDNTLAVTAAYFDIEQQDRVSDGQTPGGVEQIGAVIDGWEIQANKRWGQFETQFSYTDMNADNASSGNRLPHVAEQVASWWNKLYVGNNWRFGGGVRYIGDKVGSGGGPLVPSETLFDAMIGYKMDSWEFTVDAKNLTDEKYVSWCRAPGQDCGYGARRNITANVRYHF